MDILNTDEFLRLSNEYTTPLFIFDEDMITERVKNISSLSGCKLCYSIKANPFFIPALIKSGVVDKFEVCSPGELEICMNYKVPGDMIIYSGVHKDKEDIIRALNYGASILTAESVRHYELILSAAEELNKNAEVILRLSAGTQFGMSKDDIRLILKKNRAEEGRVYISGIHYFTGTQRTKLKHQKEELKMLKEFITGLRREFDIELPKLEYGPGLPYPYFEKDDFSDTLLPLKELSDDLNEAAKWSSLTVEMGRFLSSSAGYYITRAVDIKTSFDKTWVILDGGVNHVNYLGQMLGMMVPKMLHIQDGKALTYNEDIENSHMVLCGSLCTTNDVLVRDYKSLPAKLGDIFVFLNIGAYSVTEAMNLFLSRDMPGVIMYSRDNIRLARDVINTWKMNCDNTTEEKSTF